VPAEGTRAWEQYQGKLIKAPTASFAGRDRSSEPLSAPHHIRSHVVVRRLSDIWMLPYAAVARSLWIVVVLTSFAWAILGLILSSC
jgi:hypothetical protein